MALQAYDFSALSTDLQDWMARRFLEPIVNIEGGWEYWVQIDFPAWLDVNNATQYDFRREVTGVIQNARLDWLVNSQVPGGHVTAVEIKAQTHKYVNSRFLADVLSDVQKLSGLGRNYNKLMLAAVIDPAVEETLTGQHGFVPVAQYGGTVRFLALTV
ncbi:hypothetical protein ABE957_17390 [Halomonas sp. CS7]|uniref:DUF4143 domain-containing protein n=1 Tax=Halomonas pelophila TaxID=3151122 RepID=A0ABV1NCM2_9GAMM